MSAKSPDKRLAGGGGACLHHAMPLVFTVVLLLLSLVGGPAVRASSLAFVPAAGGGFAFDTGVLRGGLRAEGKSLGLQDVVHVPTGSRVDRGHGLAGHYRVFTVGRRYGAGAWDWPSTARLEPDGGVAVTWPAVAGERPFEMRATYRWQDAATLEVSTTVRAGVDLRGFEVFVASYFAERFTNALVAVGGALPRGVRDDLSEVCAPVTLVRACREKGEWQVFPRDDTAVNLYRDGRWKLEPHPVDWVVREFVVPPVAVRRDPVLGLAGLFLAPAGECFAIAVPHETESHYSLYLSLFGRDVLAGESATARMRLQVVQTLTEAGLEARERHAAARRDWAR